MDTDTHPIEPFLSHPSMRLHREPPLLYTESPFTSSPPTAHANETGNVRPETMDEAMGDDAKGPVQFLRRNAPAAESEYKVAESMDESTDTPREAPSHPDEWGQMTRKQKSNWNIHIKKKKNRANIYGKEPQLQPPR